MQKVLWIGVLIVLFASLLWLGFVGSKPQQHEVKKELPLNMS